MRFSAIFLGISISLLTTATVAGGRDVEDGECWLRTIWCKDHGGHAYPCGSCFIESNSSSRTALGAGAVYQGRSKGLAQQKR